MGSSTLLTGIFVLVLAVLGYYFIDTSALIQQSKKEEISVPFNNFTNPTLALELLKRLDLLEPGETNPDVNYFEPGYKYEFAFMGLKHDEGYCDKHREYIVDYPETLLEETNFITDHPVKTFIREHVLKQIGDDIQPHLGGQMHPVEREQFLYSIPPAATIVFINGPMYKHQYLGKSFACMTQIYNQIPGHSGLNRKIEVAKSIVNYADKYKDRPQCFSFDRFFPKTWALRNETQCKEFFEIFNSPEYAALKAERRIVYIRKKGVGAHRAEGVQPVNEQEEKEIRTFFGNGTLCGKNYSEDLQPNYIIQHYIHNALLLDGHKFDFRVYMLVASTNPMMLYYHDGFLRLSLHKYDVNSDDKDVLLTNTELSKPLFKEVTSSGGLFNGMNETQLRDFQMWSFDQLQDYLLKKGLIKDENWLDNSLRPQFKKAMVHLFRMVKRNLQSYSPLFELYGPDFILDQDLNLWFLECNTSPNLIPSSTEKEKFMYRMIHDQYNIVVGLMKSRMKRILILINQITAKIEKSGLPWEQYVEQNYAPLRREWKDAVRNRFEPEYEPRANNTFIKIMDDTKQGVEKYAGLIDAECLDE